MSKMGDMKGTMIKQVFAVLVVGNVVRKQDRDQRENMALVRFVLSSVEETNSKVSWGIAAAKAIVTIHTGSTTFICMQLNESFCSQECPVTNNAWII